MFFSSVTVVPLPTAERTLTLSVKLCMTAKPSPARSSEEVVYSGSIAFSTSGIPTPLSRILMMALPVDDGVGNGFGHSGLDVRDLGDGRVERQQKRRDGGSREALVRAS